MAKDYNKKRQGNENQISKKYGKDAFIEVIEPSEDFEKVTVNIVSLMPGSNGKPIQKDMLSAYFDVDDFLTLCNRISTGRYQAYNERAKEIALSQNKYPDAYYKRQGGKEHDKDFGGKPSAWIFNMRPCTKSKTAQVMLDIRKGEGKVDTSGLITLIKETAKTSVALSYDELENIANMSIARIYAYIIRRSIAGDYKNTYQKEVSGYGENRQVPQGDMQNAGYAQIQPQTVPQQMAPQQMAPQQMVPQQTVPQAQQFTEPNWDCYNAG